MKKYKLILVAGARPNFMKIAPIVRALRSRNDELLIFNSKLVTEEASSANNPKLDWKLVHTGQHYDYEMSQAFFDDLEIPKPDYFLEAGSGSHAEQTARIMTGFEKVCLKEKPDIVIVVGDVNSTLACSIVAKKLLIKVAHVEAGLRSFDLTMPEEINRMVTDAITDYFFVTEQSAVDNLRKEGKPENRIYFVGHVMIDNLLYQLKKLEAVDPAGFEHQSLKQELDQYVFLTLHRPSNVDNRESLAGIVRALNRIAENIPIVFPVHPRTAKMLKHYDCSLSDKIYQLPPLGFQESLYLWKNAKLVITDSGGMQEETTALGVPCLTLRENTERPVTVLEGTNKLVRIDELEYEVEDILKGNGKKGKVPDLWDGDAAGRIVRILANSERVGRREEKKVRR
ncbi:MAG: UDP-N-acetylglucosamine 2-epimerase (non-hydrolysing) [Desulfobacteraceae bacterium Eth-SRB1]|nr:MAG: UDP-N-acetylglucosamine 2-epimerase (non-hydrolysing) [Desulfobacteraceae bacterium Eth-SRB1]